MDTTRTGRSSRAPVSREDRGEAGPAPSPARAREAAALTRQVLGNIELAALDTELAYRGPERRNGPAASLAQLLACVLDEVDYGLLMLSADGAVVHANHAARTGWPRARRCAWWAGASSGARRRSSASSIARSPRRETMACARC